MHHVDAFDSLEGIDVPGLLGVATGVGVAGISNPFIMGNHFGMISGSFHQIFVDPFRLQVREVYEKITGKERCLDGLTGGTEVIHPPKV